MTDRKLAVYAWSTRRLKASSKGLPMLTRASTALCRWQERYARGELAGVTDQKERDMRQNQGGRARGHKQRRRAATGFGARVSALVVALVLCALGVLSVVGMGGVQPAAADTLANCATESPGFTTPCGYYYTQNGAPVLAGESTISPDFITNGTAVVQTATLEASMGPGNGVVGVTGVYSVSMSSFFGPVTSYSPPSSACVNVTVVPQGGQESITWAVPQTSTCLAQPFAAGQEFTLDNTASGSFLPAESPPYSADVQPCVSWVSFAGQASGTSCAQYVTAVASTTSADTPPTAAFTYQPTGSSGNELTFDASASRAGNGSTISSYTWDFGDGTGSQVVNPPTTTVTHTFSGQGSDTVTLTVTDADGMSGTTSKTVLVPPVVNSSGDAPALNPASGSCDTGNTVTDGSGNTVPECTLRAAMQVVDAVGGSSESITFDIPGGGIPVFTPSSPFPTITVPVTIDGTTEPGGWVTINGSGVGTSTAGVFQIQAAHVTISGLAVISSPRGAFDITGAGSDTVSGDLMGVTPGGTVGLDQFGVEAKAPSVTISGDQIDTTGNAIEAVGGSADLSITGNHIGTNSAGTALVQQASTGGEGILIYADSSAPSPGISISNNVVAGSYRQILLGGAGLSGLSVTGNEIGVGTGGVPLVPTGLGCNYGLRIDAAPSPTISDNDIGGCTYDLALSGAVNWGSTDDGDGFYTLVVLDPDDENLQSAPATGTGAQVSGNLVGVEGDGATPVLLTSVYGVDLFANEAQATLSANTVAGHTGTEMSITGGSNDIVSGNKIGVGEQGTLVSDQATAGLQISGVTNATIGGAAANDIGDIHGPGMSLTNVTGASVTNNLVGLAADGQTPLPDIVGISLSGTDTGTEIGPGNIVSGNTSAGIDDAAPGLSITGNYVGTTSSGATAVSNGTGVDIEAAATNTTVSSNLIGGDPSAGAADVTVNGDVFQSHAEAGIVANATGATITSNRIGINAQGTAAVANTDGVAVVGHGTATIQGNTIADSTAFGILLGADLNSPTLIRSNPTYANGTGIGGPNALAAPALTAADRVTTGGVTRTWLAITGLPTTGGTIEAFGNANCADPEGKYPLKLQTTTPGSAEQVVTIVGNASLQGFTVTYTPSGGSTTAFSTCATVDSSALDSNGDGIPDAIETLGPYGPQGAEFPTLAAVPTDNGGWIGLSLQGAGATALTNVSPLADPGTEPPGVSFPDGLVTFTIQGLAPGFSSKVDEIYSPTTSTPATYWKFGPTSAGGPANWYQWALDPSMGTGAQAKQFTVGGDLYAGFELTFVDGAPGDDDLTANGTITDPGGPAVRSGAASGTGYRMATADGGVFSFGQDGFFGSAAGSHLNRPVVGSASTTDGNGYWLVAGDGGVFSFGDAEFYGSTGSIHLNSPVVGMAATPDGDGYWLVAADGGIFTFGDAGYYGSTAGAHLHAAIVGMAPTPDGDGYWLVAADGGIFSFGDANFYGSEGGSRLNSPVVGMAATPDGDGYWLVATDGGIFSFGDANFYGSEGGSRLNSPVVGMAADPSGGGYWLVAADGGVFSFGDATFYGAEGATRLNSPVVGMSLPS
jgi:hypothetical protein